MLTKTIPYAAPAEMSYEESIKVYNAIYKKAAIRSKDYRVIHLADKKAHIANYEKEKAASQRSYVLKKYGITLQTYNDLLEKQSGGCAICGCLAKSRNLPVDHDHRTGKVRGILCVNCNAMLGHAKDDPILLQKGIEYLKRVEV